MYTDDEITAGTARLESGKLSAKDVSELVSVFERIFADLGTSYGYSYKSKLEALDDVANPGDNAAQVATAITALKDFGFGVATMQGGTDAILFKQEDRYLEHVLYAFSKIYPIPVEFSKYKWGRRKAGRRVSQTVRAIRRGYN